MAQKEQCFIITPIGDETDPIRRHIEGIIDAAITPALEGEYEIVAAHKISEPGSITKQVIDKLYHAKLVIANLTNRNPNVMYELALRHSTGRPAIMIAERGTALPSDIIMQRTIFYHNDAKGVLELRDAVKKAANAIDFEKKCGPIAEILGDASCDTAKQGSATEAAANIQLSLDSILQDLVQIKERLSIPASEPISNDMDEEQVSGPTLNVTSNMLDDIKDAVSVYRCTTDSLRSELEAEVAWLLSTHFRGAAADGFNAFYTNDVKPVTGEGLTQLLNGIDQIANAVKSVLFGEQGVDEQLAAYNNAIA